MAKKKAFTWITDQEQEDILAWYEKQRDSTTGKLKEFVAMVRDQDLFGKIQKANENEGKSISYMEKTYQIAQAIDANTSKAESFLHGLANWMKGGAGEAEKVYPSKKK